MSAASRVRRSLLVWVIGASVLRLTVWAPEVCPSITRAQAHAAATAAGEWMVANQQADGMFLYGWDRADDEPLHDYNLVRHAGVTLSLYQLVRGGEPEFLDAADNGLQWMFDRLESTGSGIAFADGNTAKLGASALLVAALAQRRLATGDPVNDGLMIELGRFIVGQQRDDGSMLDLYDLDARGPVPDQTSIFSTGEALWALAQLHNAFPTEGFDQPAWTTLDYLSTERDFQEGFFPQPWPDQWAAYSLHEMAGWGLQERHIDYARRLLARYGLLVRLDAQRGTSYGSLTHGPSPRGAGAGTWIEGMAALWPLTVTDARLTDLAQPAADTLACGAARLADRQVAPGGGVGPRESGAWFYDDVTRMDDQQHSAAGLLAAQAVLP